MCHTHTQFMVGCYSALDYVPEPQRDQRYADGTAIPHALSRWRLATMDWDGRRTGWPHRYGVSIAPCLPVPRGGHGRTVATPLHHLSHSPPAVPPAKLPQARAPGAGTHRRVSRAA